MVRKLYGVDLKLQENKKTNLKLAGDRITDVIIHPGETFSFWKMVGRPTAKKGYKNGLVISKKGFYAGVGGGLCQLANMIHYLVLNSPLKVIELHHHSDALFPDERRRVPFGTGTSVLYNNIDYCFKNTLDCDVQLKIWQDVKNHLVFAINWLKKIIILLRRKKIIIE
jgi:vancomycin resistance protein VanW